MQRLSLALLLVIAVLAGFTARAIMTPSGFPAATVSGNADVAMADAFYAALNDALAGESTEPLAALLAGVFLDHDADTGATRTVEAFLDDLRASGATPQGIRLQPVSVEAADQTLVVDVEPVRTGGLVMAGMTVESQLPSPHVETLRVVGGKFVDRWAPAFPWITVADPGGPAIPVPALTDVSATLMRVTVAGGMTYEWNTLSAGVLLIESGMGHLSTSSATTTPVSSSLGPHAFVTFSAATQIQLRSIDGPVTAVLFVTESVRSADVSQTPVVLPEVAQGVTRTVLWSGPFSGIDSITRYRPASMVLPANATVELLHPMGIDVLLAIDGGALDLKTPDGTITLLGSDQWPKASTGGAQLDAGHAGLVVANERVVLRNATDRPIALFVIAIERTTVAR